MHDGTRRRLGRWRGLVLLLAVATALALASDPSPAGEPSQVEPASMPTEPASAAPGSTCAAAWPQDEPVHPRPYGARAPWNVPVAGLGRHPDSDLYARRLWRDAPSTRSGDINLDLGRRTFAVYDAAEATEAIPIEVTSGGDLEGTLLPWSPAWRPPSNRHDRMVLLNAAMGQEWNLRQVELAGATLRAEAATLVPADVRTVEVGHPPARAAGIPYLAMLVRPGEIANGEVDHALSMSITNLDGDLFVAPATKLGRPGRPAGGIPAGMRFALRVSDAEIERWLRRLPGGLPCETRRTARILAEALRDHGWFVTDQAQAAKFHLEHRTTAGEAWARLGLDDRRIGGKVYPKDLLDGLLRENRVWAVLPSDQYPLDRRARRGVPCGTAAQLPCPTRVDGAGDDWILVFEDEFDGKRLDPTLWTKCYWWDEVGCTNKGNNELQWYRPSNVRLKNGRLRLRAKRQWAEASDGETYEYTSGMVTTGRDDYLLSAPIRFSFQYGYTEILAKVPAGRGLWPAFWLLPSDHEAKPEIDVMEVIGQAPDTVEMHFHYLDATGQEQSPGRAWTGPDFSAGWHVYGVEWRPDAIVWYVEGVERWRFEDAELIPSEPMYLLLNLAVGGDWPGPPDADTPLPSDFVIEYVRVWQQPAALADPK